MGAIASPLYLFGPPLLLFVSIPLTIFAVLTTTIAVSLLAIRVSVVYFELGVALIHAYLFPETPKPLPKRPPPPSSSPPRFRDGRNTSVASSSSQDTAIPHTGITNKSGSYGSLVESGEMTRDFEGVGGWREPGDENEEALWMSMNSRLELPMALPKRRHQRRHTVENQRWSWSPEAMRMSPVYSRSPVHSRSRTPVQTAGEHSGGDYFPPQPGIRPLSTASDPVRQFIQERRRRTSASGSSSSSGSASRRTSVVIKEADE